jgi:sigma-E factor negative regulatory protein RseB
MPIDEGPISHVMLTDGMASVSVYVEYVPRAQQDRSSTGLSSMGAMNAFGISTDTAFITAVGEVPGDTVRAIAAAVLIR